MSNIPYWITFLVFVTFTQGLPEATFAATGDALRARLVELKQLRDEGLIPAPIYDAEVAKAINGDKRAEEKIDPDRPIKPEPAPHPAPPPIDEGAAVQTLPVIDWGQLDIFFDISNLRKGIVKERRFSGDMEIYPALIFDVRAKETFSLATTIFEAKFLDKDGYEITNYPVDIQEKYKHLNWKPGMRGSGRIGLVGVELSQVRSIRIERAFSTMF